jgi:hypothetical protein
MCAHDAIAKLFVNQLFDLAAVGFDDFVPAIAITAVAVSHSRLDCGRGRQFSPHFAHMTSSARVSVRVEHHIPDSGISIQSVSGNFLHRKSRHKRMPICHPHLYLFDATTCDELISLFR